MKLMAAMLCLFSINNLRGINVQSETSADLDFVYLRILPVINQSTSLYTFRRLYHLTLCSVKLSSSHIVQCVLLLEPNGRFKNHHHHFFLALCAKHNADRLH
jgi:hypothetical protein